MRSRRNKQFDKYNKYREGDEFNKYFLQRLHRLSDMNIENDEEFEGDCLNYGEFISDNYGY
jgi:hypothetical protein